MKTLSRDNFVTQAQNTACAIQSLSQLLFEKIDDHCTYEDMPDNVKEQMLALVDSIEILAKYINAEGVTA